MKEIVESYFKQRSLVNHQLMSYNDCIPSGDGRLSRMERIVRSIRIGTDELVEDLPGGEEAGGCIKLDVLDKEIIVRLKGIRLGRPTIREANGAEHPATPLECRIRKLTYFSPVYMDFRIYREDIGSEQCEDQNHLCSPIPNSSKFNESIHRLFVTQAFPVDVGVPTLPSFGYPEDVLSLASR